MSAFKILIVEDEIIIAEYLSDVLEAAGYEVAGKVHEFHEAIDFLKIHKPDLVLLDIQLDSEKSGVEIGKFIHENLHIPFIYVTSYSDRETLDKVKYTYPASFLVKPFERTNLLASIEIALFNHSSKNNATEKQVESYIPNDLIVNNNLVFKDGTMFRKLPLDTIFWFKSDKNYVEVKTENKQYVIRIPLTKLAEILPTNNFLKVHRQYIINLSKISKYNAQSIEIENSTIALSREVKDDFFDKIKKI